MTAPVTVHGSIESFEAGQMSADLGTPTELAYALMSPIALARVLWLYNSALRCRRRRPPIPRQPVNV